jgi:hypothetical protein
MNRALVVLATALVAGAPSSGADGVCQSWSEGETLGELDSRLVSEASGLAASRGGERIYHINDSGGGPFLYRSALSGAGLERLRLDGVSRVVDPEALALALIGGEPMLVVGDIGDNLLRRDSVTLLAIRERSIGDGRAPVFAQIRATYPDGPHNAEGLAAAPDGTLYVFSKSWTQDGRESAPSRIYRLPAGAWQGAAGETRRLELAGEIDFPALATRDRALFSDVVTDVSMSADGSRFLVLTYGYAWEFAVDLAAPIPPTEQLERGRDYQVIRLKPLLGKETITYLPGDHSFLYGKEWKPDSRPSELIRVDCLD